MRRAGARVLLALAIGSSACAPKSAAPVAPGAPRFPDFVFPAADSATPRDVLFQHQTAWEFLQAGDIRAAERGLSALLKRAQDFFPAEAALGYAAMARKDYKSATAHFARALSANRQYAPALAGRGQAHAALNEPALALESFDAALASDPTLAGIRSSADVLRLKLLQERVAGARTAAEEGRLGEARAEYQQAILASSQSPFLFRELALVEMRDGMLPAASEHARIAVELDPADAKNHLALADVLEAQGDHGKALDALMVAEALEPGDALNRRIEAVRGKAAFAAMPEEYKGIEMSPAVTRAQLAALISVQLADLVNRAPQRSPAVLTDVRNHWASASIMAVTRAGFMDGFPNHTFQPSATIRRADLASAASRILNVIALDRPQFAARLRAARHTFPDLPPGHLNYPSASVAVEAGVMQTREDGSFELARPVTGVEAFAAIRRLQGLGSGKQL